MLKKKKRTDNRLASPQMNDETFDLFSVYIQEELGVKMRKNKQVLKPMVTERLGLRSVKGQHSAETLFQSAGSGTPANHPDDTGQYCFRGMRHSCVLLSPQSLEGFLPSLCRCDVGIVPLDGQRSRIEIVVLRFQSNWVD